MQSNLKEQISYPLKQIKVLTKDEHFAYVQKATGLTSLEVKEEIERLSRFGEFVTDNYNISLCAMDSINRKEAIAFWALVAFADSIDMNFAKASWPSQIIFRDERIDKVIRITVCDNAKYDPDMIAMRDTHDDYHMELIVGNGFDNTEINPDMLPDDEYIYANVIGAPLLEVPEIKFKKVDAKNNESKEG